MVVYEIPGKLKGIWNSEAKAMIDEWEDYYITLDEFSDTVLKKGVPYAKANSGRAWIVDSSKAKGVFSQEIQEFIGSDVFPAFAENGIKYFITILPKENMITKMSVSSYSAKAGPNGLNLLEVNSVQDAIEWLKLNK